MTGSTKRRLRAVWALGILAMTPAWAQQAPGNGDAKQEEKRLRVIAATQAYQEAIVYWSGVAGVDPALVASVITVESNGDPNATSPTGAMGLMQLMPATCADCNVQNPYEPVANIRGGAMLLAKHLRRYAGDLQKVLAAYNAGPKHADDGSWTNFPETRKYVPLVLAYYAALRPGGDGLAPAGMASTGGSSVGSGGVPTAPAAPLPAVPPVQYVDRMFAAIQQRQSELGPGQIAENMGLHDAASELLMAYMDGKCPDAKLDQRAAREVVKAKVKAKTVKAVLLTTSDGDGFAAAWDAKAVPFEGIVGLAHGTAHSQHVWVVILATQDSPSSSRNSDNQGS